RARQRPAIRLHRERARPGRRHHPLPRLRGRGGGARLVRDPGIPAHRRRPLRRLRHRGCRSLRRTVRRVGPAPAAGAARRALTESTVDGKERPPVAAGLFYPADRARLAATVDALLDGAGPAAPDRPRALVVPHAAYRYSGRVAAAAYVHVRQTAAE